MNKMKEEKSMSSMIPQYSTNLFSDIYDSVEDFVQDFKNIGIPYKINNVQTVSDTNIQTLYYLLYARYGNNPIANNDITQWKYKIFSVVFQYGPSWQKRLDIQAQLRGLTEADILAGNRAIYNHAYNPSTTPSTSTTSELDYINEQNTTNYKKGKMEAYAQLWELIDTDVTEAFLDKFKKCFKQFVAPERPLLYVTEEEEEED